MALVGFVAIVSVSAGLFGAIAFGLNKAMGFLDRPSVPRFVPILVQGPTLTFELLLMFGFGIISSQVISMRLYGVVASVALHAVVLITVTLRTL
jgi:hypothetical protein